MSVSLATAVNALKDNFNDNDFSEWDDPNNKMVQETSTVYEGTSSLEMEIVDGNNFGVDYKTNEDTKIDEIEYAIWMGATSCSDDHFITYRDSDGDVLANWNWNDQDCNQPDLTFNGNQEVANANWGGQQWVTTRYVIDYANNEGELYVDGTSYGTYSFRDGSAVDGAEELSISIGSPSSFKSYWDIQDLPKSANQPPSVEDVEYSPNFQWYENDQVSVTAENITDPDGDTIQNAYLTVEKNGTTILSNAKMTQGSGNNWTYTDAFTADTLGVYYNTTIKASDGSTNTTFEDDKFLDGSGSLKPVLTQPEGDIAVERGGNFTAKGYLECVNGYCGKDNDTIEIWADPLKRGEPVKIAEIKEIMEEGERRNFTIEYTERKSEELGLIQRILRVLNLAE